MLAYILKRSAYGVLVLPGVILVISTLFLALPDGATLTLGQRADAETAAAVRKAYGLDQPPLKRVLYYVRDLSPISWHEHSKELQKEYEYNILLCTSETGVLVIKRPYLRRSYQSRRKVSDIIGDALPNTIVLALTSLAIAVLIGIPFGVLSALRKYSIYDHSLMVTAVVGISLPSFFSGILMAWVFGYLLADYTGLSMFGGLNEYDHINGRRLALENLILPALTLGIRPLAVITQLTRSSMLDVMSQDYIRTARAKGLSERVTLLRHALRNALNPVLTAVSGWLAALLAGSFFVEYIFNWNGIGKVTVDALAASDFPVVSGTILVIALLFVVINLLVDILYGLFDPRISLK